MFLAHQSFTLSQNGAPEPELAPHASLIRAAPDYVITATGTAEPEGFVG